MFIINATNARNEWSSIVDSVIREKPKFIKRTRDYMFLAEISLIENLLSAYHFSADEFIEEDGSVTLSLNEIDLVENGKNKNEALFNMAKSILDYSEDYYNEFSYWAAGNRKGHIPYVFKALIINNVEKIGELITCRPGKI